MAKQTLSRLLPQAVSLACKLGHSNALRFLSLLSALLFSPSPVHAQFQSAFVFAADPKGVAVYTRNDVTGVLTPVAGSPFPSKEAVTSMTLDFQGRFLFTANYTNSKISMFTVDSITGALQEVPQSPFASTATKQPVFLSTENTGQFLYAINFTGSNSLVSSVESFQIDPVNLDLVPSSKGATDLPGLFKGGATHPSGKSFYAYLNDPSPSNLNAASFLLFNSSSGTFTSTTSGPGVLAHSLALDPQGQRIAVGSGIQSGQLTAYSLQSDGSLGSSSAVTPVTGEPSFITFDSLGQFLYVTLYEGPTTGYRVHLFSAASLSLQETASSPLPSSFPLTVSWIIDPTAPLIFADQVYQVDPQTGIPSPILPTSPISPPAAFSRPPGSQPIVGPVAQLSATSLSFGSLSVGQTSAALTLTITSNGGQALSLNTLMITGANSGDFTETNTCHVPTALPPGNSCSVLVSFTPSAAGNRSATLAITDNTPSGKEAVPLNGTGLTPAPAVTIIPGTLDFGTTTQGTSTSANISVKNSGTAALHIASVVLGGPNTNDFSFSATACNSAIAINATCTISVTFTPLAPGLRSATMTLTDDAPNSTQIINISGNANPAFSAAPAPGSSTAASITAGQTAQYQMLLTPGQGYSGTVSLSCSGAPLGASCQVPPSVTVSNAVPAPFTVTVSTSGGAIVPSSNPWHFTPNPGLYLLLLLVFELILMAFKNRWAFEKAACRKRPVMTGALLATLFCVFFTAAGCGGGSAAAAPQPVVTPPGTSTINVTPAAMSPTGKPLQLQPIQLTLTVR